MEFLNSRVSFFSHKIPSQNLPSPPSVRCSPRVFAMLVTKTNVKNFPPHSRMILGRMTHRCKDLALSQHHYELHPPPQPCTILARVPPSNPPRTLLPEVQAFKWPNQTSPSAKEVWQYPSWTLSLPGVTFGSSITSPFCPEEG